MSDQSDASHASRPAPQEKLEIPTARPRYDFEPVARLDELPPGELLGVKAPGGRSICLFNHEGTIGAVTDCCSHADFPLSEGALHADGTIECVWHGARFDGRSGAACKLPAVDPITVYEVRVDGDTILVGPVRKPGVTEEGR